MKPYQSPEISLEGYTPEHKENGIPDYAPPHWSVINGPYTRHYQQWLLPDPRFDGWGPEGPPVYHAGKTTRSQKCLEPTQTYTVSGRPQRQSVIKVQQRGGTGIQQCIFRRSDGATVRYVSPDITQSSLFLAITSTFFFMRKKECIELVCVETNIVTYSIYKRLECLDCKRSDFSSAQGFINHCRIAHQREYASHETAAFACGQTVEETDEGFTPPYPRNPVDPPSRNTRQTQQLLTPQSSHGATPRGSISGPSGMLATGTTPTPKPTLPPKNKSAPNTTTQRKNGRISSRAAMTTPRRESSENGSRRPPTPPQDGAMYRTPHLEGLLKRKKIEIDLSKMVKEVKGERIDWEMERWTESSSDESEESLEEFRDRDGDSPMANMVAMARETIPEKETTWMIENQNPIPAMRHGSVGLGVPAMTSARSVSRISSPVPPAIPSLPMTFPRIGVSEEPNRAVGVPKQSSTMVDEQAHTMEDSRSLFNMGLDGNYDYDASSSDDEDGYKSDADAREDVEMEVESATSHSSVEDHVSPTNTIGFKPPTQFPSQRMGSPPSSRISRPAARQTTSAVSISPALSVASRDVERELVTPAKIQTDQKPAILTPISPAAVSLSKQVRFVMPTSKNGTRKVGNNPGGVLESGLAKMKFGHLRRGGVLGSSEARKMEG